ncbi:MAG: glycosyltransferase family 2 protein, partial [Parcubacteria group bacterium]|nr:glycosyltransferase family 2 protein [Parcubacteria group bacterium]
MKVIAVIPAFNEEKTIGNVIRETKNYADEVLVVNDGSSDNTEKISKSFGAQVISLEINRGLGSALRTGIKSALFREADIVVTLDSDGQHEPSDIERLILPILKHEADVVIGTRMKNSYGMPLIRQIANWTGNLVTFLLFGIWVTDSQSGFRAFSSSSAKIIDIKSDRME